MNLIDQRKYRVYFDPSWDAETFPGKNAEKWMYAELRGTYGVIYPFGVDQPAVLVKSARMVSKVALYAVKKIQDGDFEAVFLFDPENLDKIASLIKCRRRRAPPTPEQIQKMVERVKGYRFGQKKDAPDEESANGENRG